MPQVPYKFFGTSGVRGSVALIAGQTWSNTEHDFDSATSMVRINDVYLTLPPMGEAPANAVMWTPSFKRSNIFSSTGLSKVDLLENLSIEEQLIPLGLGNIINNPGGAVNLNRYSYSTLETNGVTMYIKIMNEPGIDPLVRETISGAGLTLQAVKRLNGVCAVNGQIITTGIGNTFSLKFDDSFCIGLRMDKTCGTTANSRGRYYYYLVNRNPDNDAEIIWRMQFTFGLGNNGLPSSINSGITMPPGIAIVGNPDKQSADIDIYLTSPVIGLTLYKAQSNVTDNGFYSLASPAPVLQLGFPPSVYSGYTTGTDSLAIDYPGLDPDIRPYVIEHVPVQ